MDSIVLAADSLSTLSTIMEVAFAMLGTALAMVSGALLAWKLHPFNPSLEDSCVYHERYIDVQHKLAAVRAKRRNITLDARASDPDAATRQAALDLVTVPDLSLAKSFSVVPVPTVIVGGVRPLPVLQVG